MRARAKGFTLVELLVVIAIISVLAAMLLPALEHARTAAVTVSCMNRLRQVATAALCYADAYSGWFPHRPTNTEHADSGQRRIIKLNSYDDRPALRECFSSEEILQCPFVGDAQPILTADNAIIAASYDLYVGHELLRDVRSTGMLRVGDVMEYGGREFDVLASDMGARNPSSYGKLIYSHPDDDGYLRLEREASGTKLRARWMRSADTVRGLLDSSFAHADGSVEVFADLTMNDDRLVVVPSMNTDASRDAFLPPVD